MPFQSTQKMVPFFTYAGDAEAAMNFYVSVFPESKVLSLTRHTSDAGSIEGKVLNGTFELKGQQFMVMDIQKEYWMDFSWAMSTLIQCENEAEFDTFFERLSQGGKVMMGPEPVLMMRKVAWVTDKFGVTWQLVWE